MKPKLNIPLLRQVQEQIIAEPQHFHMHFWGARTSCSTTACIAGHAILCDRKVTIQVASKQEFGIILLAKAGYRNGKIRGKSFEVPMDPVILLGLTVNQAARLFFVDHWPICFRKAWNKHEPNTQARGEVAHARIEHFIATHGSDRIYKPKPNPDKTGTVSMAELIPAVLSEEHGLALRGKK